VLEDLKFSGDVAPAVSQRITPDDARYGELVQALFLKNEELVHSHRQLEEEDDHKATLLSNVGYELQSPLSSVLGLAHMLAEGDLGPLNGPQRDAALRIRHASEAMMRVITDVLVWTRLNGDGFTLLRENVSVGDLIQDTLQALQPLFDQKDQQVEIALDFPMPPLHADRACMRQVLTNLLDNASKFTPQGGRIGLFARRLPEGIAFEIADEGIGIAEDDLTQIFDRLTQVRYQQLTRSGGAGLGLAIAKHLVELHDGTIAIDSRLGYGTTVSLKFPL
jgi:cell cycle sensor histidine kinase DivJ